jgi:hypothetical protein
MMSISRRKILSIISRQGLSCVGIGIASGMLLHFSLKQSGGSSQRALRVRPQLLQESGNFPEEVKRLRRLSLPKYSNLYRAPSRDELSQFRHLAQALAAEDIPTALEQAADLHYEVVRFTDRSTRQVFYGLREPQEQPARGWGSYFLNPASRTHALLEAPHIVFDRFSDEIAAAAFLASSAYGFLLAGAHRHANGLNTADVCRLPDSIFNIVHQAWISPQIKTWQIHGFDLSTKSSFPNGTDIILSNGEGETSPEILDLNQRLQKNDFQSYVYDQPSPNLRESHQQVNQGLSGDRFHALGATHNIQGIYCQKVGIAFTHVELSGQVRNHATPRDQVARVISASIQATA